ncbi:DBF4-type zinc finger-containing protein 2 [Talpa occidentalis]|uniref:DBF4-type zinc finger-containing protein 2 n=1 Tax=Talpa occidentalis TaxID=50954 RepID=UPI00188EBD61|nr:DBF4-type zinc finger-containing protein 2 [Talpa occidentalis]XP_037379814.1 DBF4-type zinc finger-containing protein 2 [Talpa occidentalis]
MQNRQGYCSYCCVRYNNLEQHVTSSQHRYLTTQNRRQRATSSLMERFLQDVLRHHPHHYQESRSIQNERLPVSHSEVVPTDSVISEEMSENDAGVRREISAKHCEPNEELYSRPSKSQEYIQGVSVRPSVIQKLEKGQQQPLKFVHKIGSGLSEFQQVGIGQTANYGQNSIYSSVISHAPASCLPENSCVKPLTTNTTELSQAVHVGSISKCAPDKVDGYFEQLGRNSKNPVLSCHLETPFVSYQKPKESNRRSLCINSDKLMIQGKTLTTDFKFHDVMGTKGALKCEPFSKLVVNPTVSQNKTDMPSDKGVPEDAIPKYHEKLSNMDHTKEEKHLVFNKSAFLEHKSSVSSEMKFGCGSLHSASDQPKGFVQDIWEERQIDQEYKNNELRRYEMSFDYNPSFHSLTDQSKVIAKERNLSSKVRADLQYKKKKCCDFDSSPQVASNQIHVIVKETSFQKAMPISLVDESYESSDSEMTFNCDASLQSTEDYPQQRAKVVSLPEEVHIDLVDKDYGSSSSEVSADTFYPLQSVVHQIPVVVTETKLQKKDHIDLVDKNYGSSCSETSFDDCVLLHSVVDHPQLTVKEGNLKDRHVYLKNENQKPSSTAAHLDYDVSLNTVNTVTDEPQRTGEGINLLKEKTNLVDINCESYGPGMNSHTDGQLVANHFQEAVKEVNSEEVATNLANKSAKSSTLSDLSFNSHDFPYQPTNDQPQGALGKINVKESNVDMEVKSCGCSSCDLTFDSDPPFLSVTERSELDIEEIRKEYINLKDKNCESDSSEITFDSDIILCSVDPPQVAVYEEESLDLKNKNNESCNSEIPFNSDTLLYSRTDQPKIDVEEMFQKEEYAYLGRKNDEPSGSKINLDSYVSPPEVAVQKLHLQKEEKVHLENKENESSSSELSLDYDIFYSMDEHSEDPIEVECQKEEQIQSENKDNEPSNSEINLKSDISLHLVTNHPDVTVKEKNNQKEEHIIDKGNELSTSEISLDSDVPLLSVTHKPEAVIKEIWPQKEKSAIRFQDKSAEFSGSKINLFSEPHYSVTESQVVGKEINVQKEVHIVEENKSVTCSDSEIILNSGVPPLMTKRPQIVVLKEDHVGPEEKSSESRGLEINWDIASPLHSVINQPQRSLLKEKHTDLEDANSKFNDCKISFYIDNPPKPLTEHFQEVANKTNLCKEKDIDLKNNVDENHGSKLFNSDVSLQFVADQPEVAVKRMKLENEGRVYLEGKNSQYSSSVMSLDSGFLVQSVVDQPQINILQQEHTELESKHSQSFSSEISFGSDDPVQSVADQLRETVKEISLWKDEADMEGRRDESKGFEIVYDSGVIFQSTSGRTEEVVKEIKLWKEHVDLEDKIVQPSDSKINFDGNEPLQFLANEIHKDITEINLVREGHVCLDGKGYETSDSDVIYVSNVPLQSVVEQPHLLEEKHANRKDERCVPCGPETTFASGDHLQSVTDHFQKDVKEVSLWKEDHVYLGDKSYKLGDFEVSYGSDNPVHFVADQSLVREINLQKKAQNNLKSKNYKSIISEIKCNSGVCLQLKVDEPQVGCKEINFQKEEHLDMEEKTSESCDSDVPLHIVVEQHGVSIKEPNLQKMLFVDLVTSDNDCEIIPDSDSTFQPVIDSPQMTVKEMSCINAESFCLEGESHNYYSSPVGYVCEVSSGSLINQSRETFKVVNQKKDYIILQESNCASYGSEINFQVDASLQSLTYPSHGPDKKMVKYIALEDRSCDSSSPKKFFKWEDAPQSVVHQLQKTDKVSFQKDLENTDLKDKNCKSSVSAMDWNPSPESTIHQMIDKDNFLKLKRKNIELMSCESCSGRNIQCDPSFHSDTDQLHQAVNKTDVSKKMYSGWKEKNYDSHSNSVPVVDSVVNPGKTGGRGAIQNNLDEPVLEALPHVPPSFVGKTWSQIMTEEDIKISALVKEFREGRFHCYFDDDCETRKIKKKKLSNGEKVTWADINQETTSIQVFSDYDYHTGGISDIDDFSVALDKFSHYCELKMPYEQPWRGASRCQAVKVSHGTQTNVMSHPGTEIIGQEEEDLTMRKHSQRDREKKMKVQIGILESPELGTHVLKPLQPNALLCVVSSNMFKLQEGDKSFSLPKKRPHSQTNNCSFNIEYGYKQNSLSSPDPLNRQTESNPPLNIVVPEYEREDRINTDFDGSDLNVEDGNVDLQSFVRNESVACEWASGSSVSLEEAEILNSSAAPRESNFQLTLPNYDVAKISPKLVTKKSLESKKKIRRRKVTTNNMPGFSKMVHKPIILQQKKGIATEKQSIWIRTKLSDIIRKYASKFSVFLRHKYQSRNIFIRMHLKKRADVRRLKKAKIPARILSGSSVPSASPEEHLVGAIASSSPKQPVQASPNLVQRKRKRNGKGKCRRKKPRKPFKPVKVYALRSMCSVVPCSDRMGTRLSTKFKVNAKSLF